MPVSEVHELPDGSVFMETYVAGGHLAAVTIHEDSAEAMSAWLESASGNNPTINDAINVKREELKSIREAELDEIYPWRHDNAVKLFFRGLIYSLTHIGRPR